MSSWAGDTGEVASKKLEGAYFYREPVPSGAIMEFSNGVYFDILHPDPGLLDIHSIASSLSKLCRYTGHCRKFYSVAEHSFLVSHYIEMQRDSTDQDALEGLLHDAGESITGDLASPFKNTVKAAYLSIEEPINCAIAKRFKLSYDHGWSRMVKSADLALLATERFQLLPINGDWECIKGVKEAPFSIKGMVPERAYATFLNQYNKLTVRIRADK